MERLTRDQVQSWLDNAAKRDGLTACRLVVLATAWLRADKRKNKDKNIWHWSNKRGDNYHYYNRGNYGYGHVIARQNHYYACSSRGSGSFSRLKDAKAFVEKCLHNKKVNHG